MVGCLGTRVGGVEYVRSYCESALRFMYEILQTRHPTHKKPEDGWSAEKKLQPLVLTIIILKL